MWRTSGIWQDVRELPTSLAATLDAADGVAETAGLLGSDDVRRIVATGNGAAYYVALTLWLASLEGRPGPEVVAVPSGLVARGGFRWRPGDALLAISSSGEFRDLIEATSTLPVPYAAVTATASSTIGIGAASRALVTILEQRAVTHTQAFCGAVAATLAVWADLTHDEVLGSELLRLPAASAAAVEAAEHWADDAQVDPTFAVAIGSGPAWTAALEAALLLKEVAGVPAEGLETREGATSGMFALRPGHAVVTLPTAADALIDEAEAICRARGATVLRAPAPIGSDRRLAAVTTFPAAAALSASIGHGRSLDIDRPAWVDAYHEVARTNA
jgi:fructoselysine-6-P-deglycase FrlB-like protein